MKVVVKNLLLEDTLKRIIYREIKLPEKSCIFSGQKEKDILLNYPLLDNIFYELFKKHKLGFEAIKKDTEASITIDFGDIIYDVSKIEEGYCSSLVNSDGTIIDFKTGKELKTLSLMQGLKKVVLLQDYNTYHPTQFRDFTNDIGELLFSTSYYLEKIFGKKISFISSSVTGNDCYRGADIFIFDEKTSKMIDFDNLSDNYKNLINTVITLQLLKNNNGLGIIRNFDCGLSDDIVNFLIKEFFSESKGTIIALTSQPYTI